MKYKPIVNPNNREEASLWYATPHYGRSQGGRQRHLCRYCELDPGSCRTDGGAGHLTEYAISKLRKGEPVPPGA